MRLDAAVRNRPLVLVWSVNRQRPDLIRVRNVGDSALLREVLRDSPIIRGSAQAFLVVTERSGRAG